MFSSEEEIYQEHVLDHYEDPFHRGHVDQPTHYHEDDNPLCGDVINIELCIDDGDKIREAWFDGDGCCISQAAASMLVEKIDGQSIDFVKQFSANDMLDLFGAKLTPNRQKCCLLSWRVLQSAIYSPVDADRSLVDADRSPLDADREAPRAASKPTGPSLTEES